MKVLKTIAEDVRMTFYDLLYKITKIRALIGDWRVCMRVCNHGGNMADKHSFNGNKSTRQGTT